MDNQVRIFRKNPIAWWDKNVMRHLRRKYGKDKKTFVILRSVYLALCEVESDFAASPINSFTQTVGTYAGTSRQVAGKYINVLQKENLIKKTRLVEEKTKRFQSGTIIEILDSQNLDNPKEKPLAGYPTNGVSHQKDTQPSIKNISINKKLSIYTNVNENPSTKSNEVKKLKDLLIQYELKTPLKTKKNAEKRNKYRELTKEDKDKRDYIASEIAEKLDDLKSLGAFRVIAEKVPEPVIFEVLSSIKETAMEGKIKVSRGALFVSIIQGYCGSHGIELGFVT